MFTYVTIRGVILELQTRWPLPIAVVIRYNGGAHPVPLAEIQIAHSEKGLSSSAQTITPQTPCPCWCRYCCIGLL